MYRYLLAAVALLIVFAISITVFFSYQRPEGADYRLARDRGAELLSLHLYGAALKEFERAVKLRPREADPLLGIASIYIQLGNAAKAVQQADRATQLERE